MNSKIDSKRTIDDGYAFAKQIGLPVILKPNEKSKGEGVCKVHNKKEYLNAAKKILKENEVMLIQEFCQGRDFRIVVLDNKVISAYERLPLTITGNGKDSVLTILNKKQKYLDKIGRDSKIDITDFRILQNLVRLKIKYEDVLSKGRKIKLLDNANLSNGGSAKDYSHIIHPDFEKLAVEITQKMCLRLCGVDIITEDISKPIASYNIIEINAAPGLDNYAFLGRKQEKLVDELYIKILNYLQNEKVITNH